MGYPQAPQGNPLQRLGTLQRRACPDPLRLAVELSMGMDQKTAKTSTTKKPTSSSMNNKEAPPSLAVGRSQRPDLDPLPAAATCPAPGKDHSCIMFVGMRPSRAQPLVGCLSLAAALALIPASQFDKRCQAGNDPKPETIRSHTVANSEPPHQNGSASGHVSSHRIACPLGAKHSPVSESTHHHLIQGRARVDSCGLRYK